MDIWNHVPWQVALLFQKNTIQRVFLSSIVYRRCHTEAQNLDFSYPLNWLSVIKNPFKNLLTKQDNSALKGFFKGFFKGIFLSDTNVEIIPFKVSVRSMLLAGLWFLTRYQWPAHNYISVHLMRRVNCALLLTERVMSQCFYPPKRRVRNGPSKIRILVIRIIRSLSVTNLSPTQMKKLDF